jgi:cell wall-associated NlpC family hydrolase
MTRAFSVRAAVIAVALVVSLQAVTAASADPSELSNKRAEAARVLDEIRAIDSEVSHATEAYNLATIRLDDIAADRRRNARMLKIAHGSLRHAQQTLAERAVTLYTSGGGDSALEIILGAQNIGDLLERLDAADRVSEHDSRVLGSVKKFRAQVQQQRAQLARAYARQTSVVQQRAAAKQRIEERLSQRQTLLASIKSEIVRIEREEAARQAELRRQAAARVAAQRQASRATAAAVEPTSAPAESTASAAPESAAPEVAAGAPAARYGGVVGIAMKYLGIPYKWGGASPSTGFDCSGLVMYVYAQVGVSLPHYTGSLWNMGSPVSRGDLQPGDLVFFNGLGHMGLYIGGNQMIHAPHTGDVVKISPLTGWYDQTYVGARRL